MMASDSTDATKMESDSQGEDPWGYDLYPERKGVKAKTEWWKIAFFGDGRINTDKTKCERNVYKCFQTSNALPFPFKPTVVMLFIIWIFSRSPCPPYVQGTEIIRLVNRNYSMNILDIF